jgi:hypothetical protein
MTHPRSADLALIHLLRQSLPAWVSAADNKALAKAIEGLPSPTTDAVCCEWSEALDPLTVDRFALGAALGIIADTPEGRRVTEEARTIVDRSGDRALLQIIAAAYGSGSPSWWAAEVAVGTIEKLAQRVALVALNQALSEKSADPVTDALKPVEAIGQFRAEAAARILGVSETSKPNSAPRQP